MKGDIAGAPESHRYLVVACDLYSKWPVVAPTLSITSGNVIKFLKQLFLDWGHPKAIITDNGRQFVFTEIKALLYELGIKHRQTALYLPQSNGVVERFNRVIIDAIRLCRATRRLIDDALFMCISSYRFTPQ